MSCGVNRCSSRICIDGIMERCCDTTKPCNQGTTPGLGPPAHPYCRPLSRTDRSHYTILVEGLQQIRRRWHGICWGESGIVPRSQNGPTNRPVAREPRRPALRHRLPAESKRAGPSSAPVGRPIPTQPGRGTARLAPDRAEAMSHPWNVESGTRRKSRWFSSENRPVFFDMAAPLR